MHRLFVALRPPARARQELLRMMHGVSAVRWQEEDQLHLTLRFIGEVDRHRAEDVAAALGSIHHPKFQISVDGIGRFEKRGKGVLWAGATPHDELKRLHKKVDQACLGVGVAPDTRAYFPHITIGKFNRSTGPIDALMHASGGFRGEPFDVDSFLLYESDLTPTGPIYTLIARYPLGSR